MFEILICLQNFVFSCILLILFVHFALLIQKEYVRNKLEIKNARSFFLEGYKKSLYTEIIKYSEIIVLVIFPFTFHILIVSSMFYRSFNQTFENQANWEIGIKMYTKSLFTIIFSILFFRINTIISGSFETIFLIPENFSNCNYVFIKYEIEKLDNKLINLLGFFKSVFQNNFKYYSQELCEVISIKKPFYLFNYEVSCYFMYKYEKYWLFNEKFIWSRELFANFISNSLKKNDHYDVKTLEFNDETRLIEFIGPNSISSRPILYSHAFLYEVTSLINLIRILTLMDALIYSFLVWPICWSLVTFYTIFWSVLKRRKNSVETQKILVQHDTDLYTCISDFNNFSKYLKEDYFFDFKHLPIFSKDLFPGIIIFIDKPMRIPADLILLSGNIVVDESCLTGETTPQNKVGKTNFDFNEFFEINEKNRTAKLYAGSEVIEISSSKIPLAIVTKTASSTLIGNYLINHFSENFKYNYINSKKTYFSKFSNVNKFTNWNFKAEPFWFFCLFYGLLISLLDSYILSFDIGSIFFIISSIIYIIPFWSTTNMSIAYNLTIKNLSKNQILSTNPTKFSQIHLIDTVCFDKTGTLTTPNFSVKKIHIYLRKMNRRRCMMKVAMAACNNLNFQKLNSNDPKNPIGSKLELCLFENSDYCGFKVHLFDSEKLIIIQKTMKEVFLSQYYKFQMNTSKKTSFLCNSFRMKSFELILAKLEAFEIIERYPFDEINRLQSVIVKNYFQEINSKNSSVKSETILLVKGAIETVSELVKTSKYENEFCFKLWSEKLLNHQIAGSYTLGFCYRILNDLSSDIENMKLLFQKKSFTPLGVVELHSPIRTEAKEIISKLLKGRFHCSIITGDHINSTIIVAKELGLISSEILICTKDSYSISWKFYSKEHLLKKIKADPPNYNNSSMIEFIPEIVLKGKQKIALDSNSFKFFLNFLNIENLSEPSGFKKVANYQIFSKLLLQSIIFARFTPELKAEVIRLFECIGKTVIFVGDGSNDTIALREANVGLLLTNSLKNKCSIAPFISNISVCGLNSVIKLIIETRGLIFSYISMYLHIIMLGIFFITCKTFLLWRSQAMIPAMAWLFIDIFCTLLPLLLLSISRPKEFNESDITFKYLPELLESGELLSKNKNEKSNFSKINCNNESKYLFTISNSLGNQIMFITSFVSLLISIVGFNVMSYRLIHYILPEYKIEPCYKYNLQVPVHLWHIRQDNIESASAWCYIAFQLVNQIWPNWIKTSTIVKMKTNKYLIFWNISMNLFIIFCIWSNSSVIGCILRINCDEETSLSIKNKWFDLSSPFYGQYKNNIFPTKWKFELSIMCIFFVIINILFVSIIKSLIIRFQKKKENIQNDNFENE